MIEKVCRDHLVELAEKYAKSNGLALTTVSRKMHGNHDFIGKFKAGKCSITLNKYDEIAARLGGEAGFDTLIHRLGAAKKNAVKGTRKS